MHLRMARAIHVTFWPSPGACMESLVLLFELIFGCHHRQLSRVFTIAGRTYRVCCDCGLKFNYSLENMAMERRFGRESCKSFNLGLQLQPQTAAAVEQP